MEKTTSKRNVSSADSFPIFTADLMSNKTPLNRDCRGARTDTACNAGKGNDMTKPEFIPKLREIQSFVIPQIKQALGPLFFATSLEKKKGNVIDNGSFAYVGTQLVSYLPSCLEWIFGRTRKEARPKIVRMF